MSAASAPRDWARCRPRPEARGFRMGLGLRADGRTGPLNTRAGIV